MNEPTAAPTLRPLVDRLTDAINQHKYVLGERDRALLQEVGALVSTAAELRERVGELERECFSLAAHQCEYAIAGEGGSPYCGENARLRERLAAAEREPLERADEAISAMWRNRDGSTKRGWVRHTTALQKVHETLRALAAAPKEATPA